MLATTPPFLQYSGADGLPLNDGSIFFGIANQNPETTPVTVFWDAAGTQPAAQPIRTLNGYPVRNGTPAQVYASGDYSVTVRDLNGVMVYTAAQASVLDSGTQLSTNLAASSGSSLVGFLQSGTGAVATTLQAKARETFSVKDFGAVGDGVTDDATAFQKAIDAMNAAGGGTVRYYGRHLIDSNLTVKDTVSLVGPLGQPDELLPSTSADYDGRQGVLIVNSAATITVQDSASVMHGIIIRKGLDLPFPDAASATTGVAAFAGTALTVGGAGAYFAHLLILGFNKAIFSSGFERVRCEYVSGDCTNGIEVNQCFDISRLFGCHFWPFATTHQAWTTDALLVRAGTAYTMASVGDWNTLTNCFSYGYAIGYDINSCDHVAMKCCGADYTGASASTSIGFQIRGTSRETLLLGCYTAAQGTGMLVNVTPATGPVVTINGCNLWDNDTYNIRVQAGRAVIVGGTRISGANIGVQIDAGSLGALVQGNTFDGLTTPIAGSGTGLERSILGPNQFINCVDTQGPRGLYDNQTALDSETSYSSGTSGYTLISRVARGTVASPAIAQNGDQALRLFGRVYDGSAFRDIGSIRVQADGAPAAGATPGKWIIGSTPAASTAVTDRWTVGASGNFSPVSDNAYSLGESGLRASSVWAANGTIQTSDQREKTDIAPAALGLNFINALRPVSYRWIVGGYEVVRQIYLDRNGNEIPEGNPIPDDATPGRIITKPMPGTRTHWGLIAQEVRATCDAAGVDFGGWVLTDTDDPDSQQALRYDQFIAPLIKAVQELGVRVAELEQGV